MVDEGENYYDAPHRLFDDVRALSDAHTADLDLQYTTILRAMNPTMVVTTVPSYSVNFRAYAAAGFATCERDTATDSFMSWRGFNPISAGSRTSSLAEAVSFAKYNYVWGEHLFILYVVRNLQYVLTQRRGGENVLGPSRATDELIKAAGDYMLQNVVWVYDNYWYADKKLYQQVQKMSWETVILDEAMKKDLVAVSGKFFESKAIYDDLGVPWKRGLMFHGPPGNGKTISIKALMHTLAARAGDSNVVREECAQRLPHQQRLHAGAPARAVHAGARGHRDHCDGQHAQLLLQPNGRPREQRRALCRCLDQLPRPAGPRSDETP